MRVPRSTRLVLPFVALAALAACDGDRAVSPKVPGVVAPRAPVSLLSDGTREGGNADFFFLPPLVPSPVADTDYEAAKFNGSWKPVVEVCRLKADITLGCDGAPKRTYGGADVRLSLAEQHYAVNVDTKEGWATEGTYRATVRLVGGVVMDLGFVDFALLPNQQAVKNLRTSDVVPLQDGRTVPLKFRIEQGASAGTGSTDYKEQVVTNSGGIIRTIDEETGQPGGGIIQFSDGWLGGQASEVVVTVARVARDAPDNCSVRVNNVIQTSDCWRVTTYPAIDTVAANVDIAFCPAIPTTDPRYDAQVMYKYDAGPPATLRELPGITAPAAFSCEAVIGALPQQPGMLGALQRGLASVGRGVAKVFGPNTAYALDAGIGGRLVSGDEAFSDFFWGIPLRIDVSGDATRSGEPGSAVAPLAVRVTGTHLHVHDDHSHAIPIPGVTVRFLASAGTLGGATAVTDADGVATMPWTLGAGNGTQSVVATITSLGVDTVVTFTATAHSPLFILVNGNDVSGTTQIVTTDFAGTIATAGGPLTTGCSLVSSNPNVINLDPPAIVANSAGSAVVTATCGAASTSVAFTVQAPPPAAVSNITLRVPINTAVVYYTRMSANLSVDAGMSLVAEPRDAAGALITGVPCNWQSPSLAVEISEVLQGQADIIGRSPTGTGLIPVSVSCGSVTRTLLVSVALGNTIGNVEAIDVMPNSNTANPIPDQYTMFAGFTTPFHARPRDIVPTPQDLTGSVACGWLQTTGALVISPMVGNPVNITGSIGTSKLFVTCAGYTRELDITVIPPIG